jgi:hypothetical protein
MRFLRRREEPRRPENRELRQRSVSLPRLVESVESASSDFSVLDLGPATKANLDFFLKRGARVTVADLHRAGSGFGFLDGDRDRPYDLVFAWDVLNYLDPDRLGRLMEGLGPHFRPGTTLHAFIATGREIGMSPSRYRIEDPETFVFEQAPGPRVASPRYLEQDLLKRMPGLTVENRVQLRNGMLEYVFSYRPLFPGSVGAAKWIAPSTLAMNSSSPVPIQRTTTTRSFSQSM